MVALIAVVIGASRCWSARAAPGPSTNKLVVHQLGSSPMAGPGGGVWAAEVPPPRMEGSMEGNGRERVWATSVL
jgi:hypothetical protein